MPSVSRDGSDQEPLLQSQHDDASSIVSASSSASIDPRAPTKAFQRRETLRWLSFVCAILNCLCAGSLTGYSLYGHIFQERLHYTQYQVNTVIIVAELAMYLPVSIFGYLCDRSGPAPLSFFSAIMFGAGYVLAAFTYRSGAGGWPFPVMVVAFIAIGAATTGMYLSALTTCAKNFGRGKYRGVALACPIAAFGLSGMWQSQIASRLLYERSADGSRGDVDVFKFFIFLAVTLLVVGLLGTAGLKVVGEEELIDDAVEELERSGLLETSEYFRRSDLDQQYGSIPTANDGDHNGSIRSSTETLKAYEDEEARKKTWLLNEETRRFLKDHTMWWLAGGFFLVTGPGDTFINNLGTIIGTLYPPSADTLVAPTSAATHVSIVAITSTMARIFAGTITDMLAPVPAVHHYRASASNSLASLPERSNRFTISRLTFLLAFALSMSFGQAFLASGLVQNHGERFWVVSACIGSGYGAIFSLIPIIITVIWGVENFGTNWGIVAMVPALGAVVWGAVYSGVYQWAASRSSVGQHKGSEGPDDDDMLCYGAACYSASFWAMAISVWVGSIMFLWAWKGRGGWSKRGIAV
ncbi:MAG: putative monocarboxylate transporter mch1 [Claussenomyces sp. TS43310]|nr:MAG: putative monocarboxylate transporter mch1 [Claussenomyces sp. TS43310]